MTAHEILHIIRNPWGWSEEEVRAARLAAADLIEQQAKDIETLNSVSKEMALQEFSDAVWRASDQLMITPEEAEAGIEKYRLELQGNNEVRDATRLPHRNTSQDQGA